LPVSSFFPVTSNFNKIAIEIFIGYTELRSSNNLCNSVHHKDHASESGLRLSWGVTSSYFIYHSREIVLFPPHIANVTIAKAAQMQSPHVTATRGGEPYSNQASDGMA